MKYLRTSRGHAAAASLLMAASFLAGTVHAADAEQTNPLQFYTGSNNSYAKATLQVEVGLFDQGNSWFGNAREALGEDSDSWWESLIRPGLEGSYFLPNTQEIYGRVDAVQANTGGGLDAAASNAGLGDVSDLRVENAYAGWRSGNLFSSLGENFLDISFGRQQYKVGDGFLLYSYAGSGGDRGAYWIGGRRAAEYAGIVRMKTGGLNVDLVYLENDPISNDSTELGGATVNYTFNDNASIGGGLYTLDSDIDSRDGMNVFDIRGGVKPFAAANGPEALRPLRFDAEYVHEDRDDGFDAGNGWHITTSYQFEQVAWQPTLSYRYASFDENYDTLFYGFADWGSWYQGEIIGEYVLGNSNLDSHMVKLKVQPLEPVAVSLFYYNFTIHDAGDFGVKDDAYADELDLVIDWSVNDHLSLSLVGALAMPDDGATEHTGGDDDWSYVMLYGSIKF